MCLFLLNTSELTVKKFQKARFSGVSRAPKNVFQKFFSNICNITFAIDAQICFHLKCNQKKIAHRLWKWCYRCDWRDFVTRFWVLCTFLRSAFLKLLERQFRCVQKKIAHRLRKWCYRCGWKVSETRFEWSVPSWKAHFLEFLKQHFRWNVCVKSIANERIICFEVVKNVPKSVFETLCLW